MKELSRLKNCREFEDIIKEYLSNKHLTIQKSWEIGNEEPKDPKEFLDVLELCCSDMTFLQFKRLELYNIWEYDDYSSHYVTKKLNIRLLFNALKEIFPED